MGLCPVAMRRYPFQEGHRPSALCESDQRSAARGTPDRTTSRLCSGKLAAADFAGAPRPLGYDDQGREVVSFLEGHVPTAPPFNLSDRQLLSATQLILAFHDATSRLPLRGAHEVVCHGDLGPHNTVFRGEDAMAIIDWDADVAPGRRSVDFAHAVWCFADLTDETSVTLDEQARRARLMCDAYPGMSPETVVRELTARFLRARAQHAAAGRPGGVEAFDRLLSWMSLNGRHIGRQ